MGLRAERRAEYEALDRKVQKMRAELAAYEDALAAAEQAWLNAPDDPEPADAAPGSEVQGLGVGGAGAAHNPTVMVVNNTETPGGVRE